MKNFKKPKIEILYIIEDDIIKTSGPIIDNIEKNSLFTEGEPSDEIF